MSEEVYKKSHFGMTSTEWKKFCYDHKCSKCGNGIYTTNSVKERICFRCADKPCKTVSRGGSS